MEKVTDTCYQQPSIDLPTSNLK